MTIPVLAILKIVAVIIGIIVTYKGYNKWKESKLLAMEYFWRSMLWFTLTCLCFMIMPLTAFNLYFTQADWFISDFFLIICFAYLLPLTLILLGWQKFLVILKRVLMGVAVLFLIMEFVLFFTEATVWTYSIFGSLTGINWQETLPFPINLILGVIFVAYALIFYPLLFKKALSFIGFERKKAMFVVHGILGMSMAGILNWFVGCLIEYSFAKDFIQGLLCTSGQVLFALGMLLKRS